ncbi:MAG TPA: hypothetical protein VFV37_09210 [Luteibaculaceae bacterium]|nr:hypothetical protein [Luteibaculaceae bacterium]
MLLGFLHKRVLILLCSFLLVTESSFAQKALEDSIFLHRRLALAAKNPDDKQAHNRIMMTFLSRYLGAVSLSELPQWKDIKLLPLPDQRGALVSWLLPIDADQNEYYGYLVLRSEGINRLISLQDGERFDVRLENEQLSPTQWPGAVYYDLMPTREKEVWFLLGYRSKDRLLDHKIIEVLSLKNGTPLFGQPIIEHGKNAKYRRIFTFPSDQIFPLVFDKERQQIVFQRLVPDDNAYAGNYLFYHVNKSFDAYRWEKKKWRLQLDVPALMPERKKEP